MAFAHAEEKTLFPDYYGCMTAKQRWHMGAYLHEKVSRWNDVFTNKAHQLKALLRQILQALLLSF